MTNFNYTLDIITLNRKLISIVMIDTIKLCGNTRFNPFSPSSPIDQIPRFASKADEILSAFYLLDLETKLKNISTNGVPYIIAAGIGKKSWI